MNKKDHKDTSFQKDFWKNIYPFLFSRTKIATAEKEVEKIIEYTKISNCEILDVCCGMGRHSQHFNKLGHNVSGLDGDSYLISIARDNAKKQLLKIEYICNNFLEQQFEQSFDLVICLWNSFGFESSRRTNDLFLKKLCSLVSNGSYLVLSFACKEVILSRFTPYNQKQCGTLIREKFKKLNSGNNIYETNWVFEKNNSIISRFSTKQHLYSVNEIIHLLEDNNFSTIQYFSDYDLNPFNSKSRQVVFFAKKTT